MRVHLKMVFSPHKPFMNLDFTSQHLGLGYQKLIIHCRLIIESQEKLVCFTPFVALTWLGNIRAAPVLAPPKQTNMGPSGTSDCLPSGRPELGKTIPHHIIFFSRARGDVLAFT